MSSVAKSNRVAAEGVTPAGEYEPGTLLSQRAYAKVRGVSHTAVAKAIREGRITTVGGKINPARANREWAANTDVGQRRGEDRPRDGRTRSARTRGAGTRASDKGARAGAAGDHLSRSYASARAEREGYRAKLTELEYEARRRALVPVAEVRELWSKLARRARDQLLGVPDRLAVRLAAELRVEEVARILREELERVCRDISGSDGAP